MKIVKTIGKDLIIPELQATRKAEVIQELAACLARLYQGSAKREDIVRALTERESLGSTAVSEGIAIPHGKLESVNNLLACLARSRKGVHFESADGKPTHFFLAIIAPSHSAGLHLKLLARFTHLFKSAHLRSRLLSASKAEDMFQILAEEDAE